MTASTHSLARILVADPDWHAGRMLSVYLLGFDYQVSLATTSPDLDVCLRTQAPDLIVMDSSLLAESLGQAGQALRERTEVPFILLCQAASSGERAEGLDSGAHDVMSRPFEPRELVARLQAVLRRVPARAERLTIDHTLRETLWVADNREPALIRAARGPGRVFNAPN